jgi:predicted Zn-dependent protease
MSFPKENPQLPEGINNQHDNPFVDFVIMAGALLLAVVAISFLIGWGATRIAPAVPFEWEPNLSFGPSDVSSEQDERIAEYLQQLTAGLIPDDAEISDVNVHWLPDIEAANAFATSGGNIHVTRGLLDAVKSENGLAMVLAHEYAHIELRHPVVLMLEQIGHTLIALVTGVDNSSAGAIAQQTGFISLMAFSRDMERAADKRAVSLLEAYYGHSRGSEELFEHILQTDDERSDQWGLWQSHPATRERIEFLESQKKGGDTHVSLRPLPAWLEEVLNSTSSHQ